MTFYLIGIDEKDALADPDGGHFLDAKDACDYRDMQEAYRRKTFPTSNFHALKVFEATLVEYTPKPKDTLQEKLPK